MAIRLGEVVAYPTETVYGLGVDPFSESAVDALKRCKGRPETNPIVLIIADPEQLDTIVRTVSPQARSFIDAFWPGPLTVAKKNPSPPKKADFTLPTNSMS